MNEKALTSPVDFDAANRWLKGRVNVLNNMTSREISLSKDFQPAVRVQSFFSAKVAEARILDKLREVSDEYSQGKINLATARAGLKTFLLGEGYTPDDVAKKAKSWKAVTNLASTARLNLILKQNARMATAVGENEVSFDPDIMERFPYFRYIPSVAVNKREEHKKFYNTVLPKSDPFWNTHTPPIDFNCKCSREDLTEEEAAEYGVASASDKGDGNWTVKLPSGKTIDASVPASGFVFDVSEAFRACDMSRIENIPMRRAVFISLRHFAHSNPETRFKCVPGKPVATLSGSAPSELDGFISKQLENMNEKGALLDGEFKLGSFSVEMKEALGLGGNASLFLSKGSSSYGIEHSLKRHEKELKDGSFASALRDTLFSGSASSGMEFAGKKVFLNVENKETGAFASAVRIGEDWSRWEVISAHYPGHDYGEKKRIMKTGLPQSRLERDVSGRPAS